MRSLYKKRNASASKLQPVENTFLHEYQSDGHKLYDSDVCPSSGYYKTELSVVFDGETQHRFSSVRIILYGEGLWMPYKSTWGPIRKLEPVTHGFRSHVHHAPPNDPTLPQLTVSFEVIPHLNNGYPFFNLIHRPSYDELCSRDRKIDNVLLQIKHSITSNTLYLSIDLEHSTRLLTLSKRPPNSHSRCSHTINSEEYVSICTVRVVPLDGARPRTTIRCLPTELLLKIFEATDPCNWQQDLLSFAQVCRQWSCSMKVLFSRLEYPKRKYYCHFQPSQYLEPRRFAKALSETPTLGLEVQHLVLNQHNGSRDQCCFCDTPDSEKKSSPGFTPVVIAILRATKHLQRLTLSPGYFSEANTLFSALPKLHDLRTLSITGAECQFAQFPFSKYWGYSVNAAQLARCMARWSSLTSLMVERLAPGNIGMRQLFLGPPACALTQLCIHKSHISDKDLLYLTASSANTLAQVTLDDVRLITHEGLYIFLDSISRNVTSLTIRDIQFLPRWKGRFTEYALDVVVDKMRRLEVLNIRGNVATERMLRRRSGLFVKSCDEGDAGVPVVRLSSQVVPGIRMNTGDEWPGWEVIEFR